MIQKDVGLGDEMAKWLLRDMGIIEGFVYFRSCVVQSSPLIFAPNRPFECGPLPKQVPVGTLSF